MSIGEVLRYSGGDEPHQATVRNGKNVLHYALNGDRLDFGGAAAGSTPQVLDAAGAGVLSSTWVSCDGWQLLIFKLEFSVAGTRQFRVWLRDFNGTAGQFPMPEIHSRTATAVTANVLESTYRHAPAIVVPIIGAKEATLELLDDGLSVPAVSAWLGRV